MLKMHSPRVTLLLSQVGKTLIQANGNKLYANYNFSRGTRLARLHHSQTVIMF